MKRLIAVILLSTLGASLSSCSGIGNSKATTTTVEVEYDYGRIQVGKITTLFNGCFIYFEYSKPDRTLIPGDTVTFKHTGQMFSTMSFPGNTRLNGGEVKEVSYSYATVSEVEADKIMRDGEGRVTSVLDGEELTHVIINDKFDFIPLNEYTGDKLFASYSPRGISALFAFNPRA